MIITEDEIGDEPLAPNRGVVFWGMGVDAFGSPYGALSNHNVDYLP